MHVLTAPHSHSHSHSVFMPLPCSVVSPSTDKLIALKLEGLCVFPLLHVLWSVHMRQPQYPRGLHTRNSLQEPAFHSHTHTHIHKHTHTTACTQHDHRHTPTTHPHQAHSPKSTRTFTHSGTRHTNKCDFHDVWGDSVSQQGAEAYTKPQSPASPPGAAAQPEAPARR